MADSIPYIFQAIQNSPKKNRINILRHMVNGPPANDQVKQILIHAFHPKIKFLLPPGTPPYVFRGTPEGFPMTLYPEVRKFYLFCEGGGANIDGMKREQIFIELLETIHPDEAQVVIAMKDKKFTQLYSNITYDLVRQALPEIKLPEPEAKKPKGKKHQKT